MRATPYHTDLSDLEFAAFIPKRISEGRMLEHDTPSSVKLPRNALKLKVDRLTEEINKKAAIAGVNGTYDMARMLQGDTSRPSQTRQWQSVTDAEVWYHRSGCFSGKVILVQVATSQTHPFISMISAKMLRNEPEDKMLLLSAEVIDSLTPNPEGPYAGWSKGFL